MHVCHIGVRHWASEYNSATERQNTTAPLSVSIQQRHWASEYNSATVRQHTTAPLSVRIQHGATERQHTTAPLSVRIQQRHWASAYNSATERQHTRTTAPLSVGLQQCHFTYTHFLRINFARAGHTPQMPRQRNHFSGQKIQCIMATFVVATTFRHRGLNVNRNFACHRSSNTLPSLSGS